MWGGGGGEHSGTEWIGQAEQKPILRGGRLLLRLKKGQGGQFPARNHWGKNSVYSIFCEETYIIFLHVMVCGRIGVSLVYLFCIGKYDFRGRWSATPKHRWRSKTTERRTALKSRGGCFAEGRYFQRGSAPPPP